MEIIIYTTHCPQCSVLAKKLDQKGIRYIEIDDIETMRNLGIMAAPMLSINGNEPMNFKDSINWINSLEV